MHLLGALLLQEESLVTSILEKLDIDVILLTDTLLEGSLFRPNFNVPDPNGNPLNGRRIADAIPVSGGESVPAF